MRIEAAWLLALVESVPQLLKEPLSEPVKRQAVTLALEPGDDAPGAVKAIESRINHDVKAVAYFVREKLGQSGATPAVLELVHFGCTSEDINNLAYARMLRAARAVLTGELERSGTPLRMSMRSSQCCRAPTARPRVPRARQIRQRGGAVASRACALDKVEILAKWNGAVGNYNAHVAALPGVDWPM